MCVIHVFGGGTKELIHVCGGGTKELIHVWGEGTKEIILKKYHLCAFHFVAVDVG